MTIKQAADLLQTSESQVRRWIRDDGLPAVLFHEQYRLNRLDLMVWAQQRRIAVAESASSPGGALLAAALQRGGIHRDVDAASAGAALQAAAERLQLPAAVDRELLSAMIAGRQRHGTTAIGHGIAIPHARYPIVAALPEPVAGLLLLQRGVDFAAPDGLPVRALFVLVTNSPRAHLDLLAALARALSGELLAPVLQGGSDEQILAAARIADAGLRSEAP